jgi:hypothetical protein
MRCHKGLIKICGGMRRKAWSRDDRKVDGVYSTCSGSKLTVQLDHREFYDWVKVIHHRKGKVEKELVCLGGKFHILMLNCDCVGFFFFFSFLLFFFLQFSYWYVPTTSKLLTDSSGVPFAPMPELDCLSVMPSPSHLLTLAYSSFFKTQSNVTLFRQLSLTSDGGSYHSMFLCFISSTILGYNEFNIK